MQGKEPSHDIAQKTLREGAGSVLQDSPGQVGRVRVRRRIVGQTVVLTIRCAAAAAAAAAVATAGAIGAFAERDAGVGLGGHTVGQRVHEQLVEGRALVQVRVQVGQEVIVDAQARDLLNPAMQALVKQHQDLVLERAGLELVPGEVQAQQALAAHVAELCLGVGEVGAGAAAAVLAVFAVGPLDEVLEHVGVLVGEMHDAQLDVQRILRVSGQWWSIWGSSTLLRASQTI